MIMTTHGEAEECAHSGKDPLYIASVIMIALSIVAMLIGVLRGQILAIVLAFVAINSSIVVMRLSRRFRYYVRDSTGIARSPNVIMPISTTMVAALVFLVISLVVSFMQ